MLNLVQTEFLKLRRKKMIWFMLLAAFIMPFFSFIYYNYFEANGIDPVAFYKLAAFGYTPFIILPFVLGVFCVVLMHDENRYDMLKQLWIVPCWIFGRKVFGDWRIDRFCCYADFSPCRFKKGLYFSRLHDAALCISRLFYHVNQYVPASCVQHFRYHCKKRKYSGTCFRTEYQCPVGVVLYLYLGCAVCAVCCFFASQEKVR